MPFLKQDDINKIKSEFALINSRYSNLTIKLGGLHNRLKTEKAKEYLTHGVMRRLGIMMHSIKNVFTIFPIERNTLLSMDELRDVDINLHAFFVNIFGLLDNLAWVLIHEKQLAAKIGKKSIGLYMNKTQEHLTVKFRSYLNSDSIKKWYDEYLKNYRDALSHRIPPYVPPKTLNHEQASQEKQIDNKIADCYKSLNSHALSRNRGVASHAQIVVDTNAIEEILDTIDKLHEEQKSIGEVCFLVSHAFSESKIVVLHAQLIADFNTIEDIVEKYCEMFLE